MKHRKIIISFSLSVLLVLIFSMVFIQRSVIASNAAQERTKIVKSILVEENDTLWGIATQYYTSEYKDINEYILEIKKSNGISSDTIHIGRYLIIPHYI
jgi:LysM repeat protein